MSVFWETPVDAIIFATGIINLVIGLALFSTCRFVPVTKVVNRLMKYKGYQQFYKFHNYLWWVFIPSIILHAVIAIVHVLTGG